jgi:hypothetical protein
MVDHAFHIAVAWELPGEPAIMREALGRGRQLLAEHGVHAQPMQDWEDLRRYLDDLYEGRVAIGDSDRSLQIAEAALRAEPPVAGVVPAFAVVAEWEGPVRDTLTRTADGARNWGWHGLALPLARGLVRADATWSARALTDIAVGVVSMATDRLPPGFPRWYLDEAIAGFRDVAREIARRHDNARDELAYAVRRACRPADAPMRPVVAALWWTLGAPWHAAAVASDGLVPTLRETKSMVDALLRSLGADSLVGAVGAQLWAVPGMDGAAALRRRLGSALSTEEYERLEAPFRPHGISPCRLYADVLVDWFAGRVRPDAADVAGGLAAALEATVPRAAIKLRALQLLISGDPRGWSDLAGRASALVADENWLATEDPYDRAVDLPFHYLDGGPDERLAALERQRAAALSYPLLVERTLAAREADDPRGDRHELLAEARGMRLVTQLRHLPPFLTRAYRTLRDEDFEPGATRSDWADTRAAVEELWRIRRRLEAVVGGDGAAGSLHDFSAALT